MAADHPPLVPDVAHEGATWSGGVLDDVDAEDATFVDCAFTGVVVAGGRWERSAWRSCELAGVRFAGARLARSRWLDVRLANGEPRRVRAIGFVMDRRAAGYAGELDRRTLLDTVCGARGRNGTCADYVISTVQSLAEHRIHDRHLARLAEEVGVEIAFPRQA